MRYLPLYIVVAFISACMLPGFSSRTEIITPDARTIVSYLASDELGGRDNGSEGIHKAALFIERYFESLNIKPYFSEYRDSFKVKDIDSYNIVGWIEGNDPSFKDEFVIIGAHYDHIGRRARPVDGDSIANGANDNATGTAAVMLLAKYFALNPTNKRSIIFALFSAEELGLVGSEHLSEKLKEDGLDLYTMVNFEMVGVPLTDRDYKAFVSGYDLSNLALKINEYVGDNLIGRSDVAVKYDLFKRSDNYPFYLDFEVPCQTISSCDLTNFDYYHHVDDEAPLMDYEYLTSLVDDLAPAIEKMTVTASKEIQMNDE